ncbi:MAG: CRISPR-associated protein Cas4 [Anaerobutyricum sp.]|nr:CRISPR-associated protein Cas4 [Anaerobutyricum sp.]
MSSIEITIRSIQHYLYCSHRWGLLEIDKAWAENVFVTKANLLHSRVHNPENNYTSRGKKVFTSVPVYNDLEPYNLYGITDCLEFYNDPNGISINGSKEKYQIYIVEYKSTKPKDREYREDDLMQVFAQKICVDFVFGCDCKGVIYYADVKKRVILPLKENFSQYDKQLLEVLRAMREYLESGEIPPKKKKQKCSGCSLKDICMPSLKPVKNMENEIKKIGKAPI